MINKIQSIKLKFSVVLIGLITTFSCGKDEISTLSRENVNIFDSQKLQNTFSNSFREANVNGLNYVTERDGRVFVDLSGVSEMGVFAPADSEFELVLNDNSNSRIEVNEEPEQLIDNSEFSNEFKIYARKVLEFASNLEFMSFDEGVSYLEKIEEEVKSSNLDEFEKISIDEVLHISKIILQESHEIAEEVASNGRTEKCVDGTNWRGIAQDAITAGLGAGAKLGWSWAVKGAIATTAGGQPLVGGVIGGLAGFTTGFLGAAIAVGTASYISRKITGECDEETNAASLAVDFICLDPLCNERVSRDGFLSRSNFRIDGVNNGVIYFYGGQ